MNLHHFILILIIGILFSFGMYYLMRSILIYKKADKHFFFSVSVLGVMICVIAEFILTFQISDNYALIFHKIKIAGLYVTTVGWFYTLYEIFFDSEKLETRIYLSFFLIFLASLPTDISMSAPVRILEIDFFGHPFIYRLSTGHWPYSLLGLILVVFGLYSILKILFRKNLSSSQRIFGIIAFSPIIIGGGNDFSVGRGLIQNIMISQYVAFLYLGAMFVYFLLEDLKYYRQLISWNETLEKTVESRTEELKKSNTELILANRLIQKELKMAKRIQKNIIPESIPEWNQIQFSGIYQPLEDIGGDFYDIFHIDTHRLGIVIADVSGHGVPAALITMMAKVSFNSNSQKELSPGNIMTKVNLDIYSAIGELENYLTAFYGIIDLSKESLEYCNAGHQEIYILYRNGEIGRLFSNATILGTFTDEEFRTEKIRLKDVRKIILYTDGIPEAQNIEGKFYTPERFISKIHEFSELSAQEMTNAIFKDVKNFKKDQKYNDDLTLLIIEFDVNKESLHYRIGLAKI